MIYYFPKLNREKIRTSLWSLIFSFLVFCLFFVATGCSEKEKTAEVTILWEVNRPVALVIPRSLIKGNDDSLRYALHIFLEKDNQHTAMLGNYTLSGETIIFRPLIPFTRGLVYEVKWQDDLLAKVPVPVPDASEAPVVVNIYPQRDTLPENLLKFYIEFSKPMVSGEALQHIALVKNGLDTMPAVFLDLQPELWNNEGTLLTLWLDPGRIKRDLQPNKAMGPPLEPATHYELIIRPDWRNTEGISLRSGYSKKFFTGVRDDHSPDPSKWTIHEPKIGTTDPYRMEFGEPLDYILLKNAIRIIDNQNQVMTGTINIDNKESSFLFTPSKPWKRGQYVLEVESRLEDNAGNNLNRLFDNDIMLEQTHFKGQLYRRSFDIN